MKREKNFDFKKNFSSESNFVLFFHLRKNEKKNKKKIQFQLSERKNDHPSGF